MKIVIPTNCPSCDSLLERVNSQIFCRNKSCEAQTSAILEGFCNKMKIKGFGAKTLEKININSISALYQLTEQDLVSATSAKIGAKLFLEIENSKAASFEDFIQSLGINLIGSSAASKIVQAMSSPTNTVSLASLRSTGLGEKASESFLSYCKSARGIEELHMAATLFTFQVKGKEDLLDNNKSDLPLLEVCITGKLNDFASRSAVTEYLKQFNVVVKDSVTKNVKVLICEDESKKGSSSYKKAISNNLKIKTIKELLESLTI